MALCTALSASRNSVFTYSGCQLLGTACSPIPAVSCWGQHVHLFQLTAVGDSMFTYSSCQLLGTAFSPIPAVSC